MTQPLKSTALFAALSLAFVLGAAPPVLACRVGDPVFTSDHRSGDLEGDLADYGRIHMDAADPSCAQAATWALTAKIKNTIDARPDEFTGWLRGAHVSMIFAAALRIGANGFATKDLDNQLQRVAASYAFNRDASCGNIEGTNSCLDDYSQAAVGYAWIAAYKYRRDPNDASVATFRSAAIAQIGNFFGEVCIHSADGSPTLLCNGSVAGLADGTHETISFNHGGQMPPYGFGLMTSIASAVLGLQAAGHNYKFSSYPGQITIARALMKEMQQHVDTTVTPAAFKNDCSLISRDALGAYAFAPSFACGGPDGYQPEMYALFSFYKKKLGGVPGQGSSGVYQSSAFRASLFDIGPTSMAFFGVARHQVYGQHGHDWWVTTPAWMPFDRYNPKGFLEALSATGLAQGWACDQDAPTQSIPVDLYAGATKVTVTLVRADSASEPAVAAECGGGSYHRFWIQLPSWTRGQAISAYGLDYTWYGVTPLPCLQTGGCSW